MAKSADIRRSIPSVEKMVQAIGEVGIPRPLLVNLVRKELAQCRKSGEAPDPEDLLAKLRDAVSRKQASKIQPVINGTGILIHTNLARSPLSSRAVRLLEKIAGGYCNLEYDIQSGERGSRGDYLESCLALLCQAEATTVVNNCAAALLLALKHFLADEKAEVVISRGELVQIGGGFRIPEMLESSGAVLREVGTTNRTTVADYSRGIGSRTALILKIHRSNFFMDGFVEAVPTRELSLLARKRRIPLMEDLGSGAMADTALLGIDHHEPTAAEVLSAGADLVCFSGDKLFGGPQAGILAGKQKTIAALKKNPFFRAIRCDKLILGALQETVEEYLENLSDPATTPIPLLQMLATPLEDLERRGQKIIRQSGVQGLRISNMKGEMGGGTLPKAKIPSIGLEISCRFSPSELSRKFRETDPPLVGFVAGGKYRIDLRTVFPDQDRLLVQAIQKVLS